MTRNHKTMLILSAVLMGWIGLNLLTTLYIDRLNNPNYALWQLGIFTLVGVPLGLVLIGLSRRVD